MTGISYATLHKLERGENMMTDVLNNICIALNCDLGDIAEVIPDESISETEHTANMNKSLEENYVYISKK